MRKSHRLGALLVAASLSLAAQAVHADEPVVEEARRQFAEGAELVERGNWSYALVAFQRSARLRPHPVTTYNIGVCQRALGFYAQAWVALRRALEENAAAGGRQLSDASATKARALLVDIYPLIPRATVQVMPPGATISVDARPLAAVAAEPPMPTLAAGVRPPGPGEPPPAGSFLLLLDPGTHVIALAHRGFSDAAAKRDFPPGSTTELKLALERLPTLHVTSDPAGAQVRLDDPAGAVAGTTPLEGLALSPGPHRVFVSKPGFPAASEEVRIEPGTEATVRLRLSPEARASVALQSPAVPPAALRPVSYVPPLVVGLAALAALAAGTSLVASVKPEVDRLDLTCLHPCPEPEWSGLRTRAHVGYALWAIAGALAAADVALWIHYGHKRNRSRAAPDRRVWVGPAAGAILAGGNF